MLQLTRVELILLNAVQGVWRRCHFLILEAVVYIYIYIYMFCILFPILLTYYQAPLALIDPLVSACGSLMVAASQARRSQKLQGKSGERQIAAFCQCRKVGSRGAFLCSTLHTKQSSPWPRHCTIHQERLRAAPSGAT